MYDETVSLILRALALSEPAHEKREACLYFVVLARAEIHRRNFVAARIALSKAIEFPSTPLFMMQFGGTTLETASMLAEAVGQLPRAARLGAAGEAFSRRHSQHREPGDQREIEQVVSAVRSRLGEEEFLQEWEHGECLALEDALAEAMLV